MLHVPTHMKDLQGLFEGGETRKNILLVLGPGITFSLAEYGKIFLYIKGNKISAPKRQ